MNRSVIKKKRRSIFNHRTGELYLSVYEASKMLNINRTTMLSYAKGFTEVPENLDIELVDVKDIVEKIWLKNGKKKFSELEIA